MDKHFLWEKAGNKIQNALNNIAITEIMRNPDNRLWVNDEVKGPQDCGYMDDVQAVSFVNALAQYKNMYLNENNPFLDCTLPFNNERINVTIPPIVNNVSFNIRKKSKTIHTFDDYVKHRVMTRIQSEFLHNAIIKRKNILVSGGPGSGKTTFANSLLEKMNTVVPYGHRILILEQVPELQCTLPNHKVMLTSDRVNLRSLLWIGMRNSPDRIIIGEVRDGAALEMLKAWNTGCPGGIATIHANSPQAAIQRVLDLSQEISERPPIQLAVETINIIVQLTLDHKHSAGRYVSGIVELEGYDQSKQTFIYANRGETYDC